MQTVIEYRFEKAIHHQLLKASKNSMLGIDALILIYHFARTTKGGVLEIGSFVGGSTTAAALGLRDSGLARTFMSVEPGGRLKSHRLATRNIHKTLRKNLSRAGVFEAVTLLNGYSFDESVITAIRQQLAPGEVDLFIFDADANVRRDIDCYADRFAANCWLVIDDYFSGSEKGAPTREQVNELVHSGRMECLGYYGWGTWVGRWRG